MATPRASEARGYSKVVPAVVAVIGLAITTALSIAAIEIHNRAEDRLLGQRVLAAATVFQASLPGIETPLAAAAEVVEQTNANDVAFARVMTRHVGPARSFIGASVWSLTESEPLVQLGETPSLAALDHQDVIDYLSRVASAEGVAILDLLDSEQARVGFGTTTEAVQQQYVVYAETALPPDRTGVTQLGAPFDNLDYALYLGDGESDDQLMIASTPDLPLDGRRDETDIPVGDTNLHLVLATTDDLGRDGNWWWIVLLSGLGLTFGATFLTARLVRARTRAQLLSEENEHLYAEQRTVAQTLAHSLVPVLPQVDGLDVAGRYQPGVAKLDVGGDWYDFMAIDDDKYLLVVGDVSGRGLEAATLMVSLRHSIRAFAADGDAPGVILDKLGRFIDVGRDRNFATVLCAIIDCADRTVTLANAGHLPPLLVQGATAEYTDTRLGPPVGVSTAIAYETVTFAMPEAATLIVFTDGLVERRGEPIDAGLERLRQAAASGSSGDSLEAVLSRLLGELTPDGAGDDTAILGLRWTN